MITCVTAPSRSGTSLMMQMLQAAGMTLAWNALPNRQPWNERGFYEVNWTAGSITLDDCENKVVKVMPFDLWRLTPDHEYQFITIMRDVQSVEASMAHTVQWRGSEMGDAHKAFDWQRYVLRFIAAYPHIVVRFDDLFTGHAQQQVAGFLGLDVLQTAKMNDCVDPSMRHFTPEAK